MRSRLIAALLALLVIAALPAIPVSSSRACCCKSAAGCPMHQKHDAGGCRVDRCGSGGEAAMAGVAAVRAVLVAVPLPHPGERSVSFLHASDTARTRVIAPDEPPPRA